MWKQSRMRSARRRSDMVIVKIGDGLGNQMYNYVCGYSVAKHDRDTLLLDTSEVDNSPLRTYGLDKFNIDYTDRESFSNKSFFHKVYKRLRRNLKYNVIYERPGENYPYDLNVYRRKFIRNKYLQGYFQNIFYFQSCREDILRQFTPKERFSDEAEELIRTLSEGNTCSLHVRGGDIEPLPIEYYKNAVKRLGDEQNGVKFIVFSNVRELAEKYAAELGVDAQFIWNLGKFTDIEELFLMRACKRHILSDSTFSRWAAFLDVRGGEVYAPYTVDEKKIYSPEWIKVEYGGNEEVK